MTGGAGAGVGSGSSSASEAGMTSLKASTMTASISALCSCLSDELSWSFDSRRGHTLTSISGKRPSKSLRTFFALT